MRTIRKATPTDIGVILRLIELGKQKMRSEGNDEQWTGGNPKRELLEEDVRHGHSYLIEEDDGEHQSSGHPIATFAFIPSPEPTYAKIYEGCWLDDERPYYVIHRAASCPEVHGIMTYILDYAFSQTDNIKIDTHRKNKTMQRALIKKGFTYCGIIYLQDGAERLAYQKIKTE